MATESRPLIAEYRGKFPEISEEVLVQIIQEYGSDPNTCQKVLQEESRKCLYGCLSTESPVFVPKPLIVSITKTTPGTNNSPTFSTSFIRSNSTGSTSSSGRSTPVNQIATPWVVPKPFHSPISPSNNPFNTAMASNQQTSPSEGYPPSNDNTQTNIPGCLAAANRFYQTVEVRTGTPTSGSHGPQPIIHPLINGGQGTYQGSPYYTMPSNNLGPADPRYHMLPVGSSSDLGTVNAPLPVSVGAKIGTPYYAPNTVPVQSLVRPRLGQLYVRTNEPCNSGDESQYPVNSNPTQFSPLYQTSPNVSGTVMLQAVSAPSTRNKATYLTTNTVFAPITHVGSPNTDQHVTGVHSPVVRQCSDDEYLKACLSRQWKRFQNLEKERAVENERLELLIREISDRDNDVYNQKYRVAPNPTDEQIHQLTEENIRLNRTIDEISKNVDRLDNGQDVLPLPNPQVYHPHRIPGSIHEGPGHLDRSNSVPYIAAKPKGSEIQHPLQHQMSVQDLHYQCQWNCLKCTFLNHEILLECEMCGTTRTGAH